MACEHQEGSSWETRFKGPAGRYQSLAPTLENLVGEAQEAHASIGLSFEYPGGLPLDGAEYEDLRHVLNLAGLGRTRFVREPPESNAK